MDNSAGNVYTEAEENTEENRTELEQKAGFLRLICQSLTRKMQAETAYHDLYGIPVQRE